LRAEDGRLLGYKTDQAGKNVTSRLDETALRSMATATGGMYFRATDGEVEVVRLLAEINGMEKKNLESRVWGQTEDHYSIPLLIGLLLLFLEFLWPETSGHVGRVVRDLRSLWSKKSVAALFLVFSFFPTAGYSLGRLSPLARGARAVEKNPNDPVAHDRLAHALYADNNFATAAESFGRAQGLTSNETQKIEAAYNTGNALFQQGKLKEAVEKYKEVLHKNPADLDAKYNLEMAQRLLKTQPPQKDNKNKKDDENKKDDKNKDQESDGKKSGSDKKEESDQKPKPGEMSKEDAERLLQAVEAQEKEAQRDANKKNPPAESNGVDW